MGRDFVFIVFFSVLGIESLQAALSILSELRGHQDALVCAEETSNGGLSSEAIFAPADPVPETGVGGLVGVFRVLESGKRGSRSHQHQ